MPAENAVSIASKLFEDPTVNPTGLGARDSLRLEAGLCLYGHDLNETINPVEATLAWTMGGPKGRRRKEGGFWGAESILQPDGKLQKVAKKRVGIMGMKAPAREGAEIYDAAGENKIGEVTSGTFSPCLKGKCHPSFFVEGKRFLKRISNADNQILLYHFQPRLPWGTWKHTCRRREQKSVSKFEERCKRQKSRPCHL